MSARKSRNFFGINLDQDTQKIILSSKESNKFLNAVRKVIEFLQVDGNSAYMEIMANNISNMSAEISLKIDALMEELNIPFRTEDFLLILFQELYEQFVLTSESER